MSNMVVATNVLALNSHRSMKLVGNDQARASARLSSGYRINSAADDAAGLAISEKMRAQIRGLDQASRNGQDAISLIQTAEGGMQEIDNMIQRIRELVVQVSNDTNENNNVGTGDRQKIQDEIDQLTEEIDSMAERVEFNKKKVINGSFADTKAVIAVSQKEYQNALTANGAAAAKVAAIKAAIDDGTAAHNGLLSDLNSADSAVYDPGTGSQDVYNSAVTVYATAEVSYDTAKTTYEAAKSAYVQILEAQGSSTTDVNDTTLAAAVLASATDPNAAAFVSAFTVYQAAVAAWGSDALGLSNLTGANTLNQAAGAISTFDAAKATFATQQATYDTSITLLNSKRAAYDAAQKNLVNAQAELKSTTLVSQAAGSKLTAAKAADATSFAKPLYFQVGANSNQSLIQSIGSVKTDMLGIGDGKGNATIDVVRDTGRDTTSYLDILDIALSYVTTERSKLGAAQNRLEYTIKSLDISSENLSASESRIRDADMAKEMMALTRTNVLQQAATSMLAQANQAPQNVLQLLR